MGKLIKFNGFKVVIKILRHLMQLTPNSAVMGVSEQLYARIAG